LRNWENIHYQYRSGMLTGDEWRGFRLNLEAICEWPTVRTVWKNEKQFFSGPFQEQIDEILEKIPETKVRSHEYAIRPEREVPE